MALYSLKELSKSKAPLDITVFEAGDTAGCGSPYSASINASYMLCNAFSREIPSLASHLTAWLKKQPVEKLNQRNLSPDDITARAFYPRVLVGEFLTSQFSAICEAARRAGHVVEIRTKHRVTDIAVGEDQIALSTENNQALANFDFDAVVIATGHKWPDPPRAGNAQLLSPWPYTNIVKIPPSDVGMLGSSLTAVDIAIALAHTHGEFVENGEKVSWFPAADAEALRMTMVSRKGIMPEADFYYPYPYEPLQHLTPTAVAKEIDCGADALLERVFALLLRDLQASDPDYMSDLGPDARSIAGFGEAYFAHRQELGGFQAVQENFSQSRKSIRDKETIPYRYVLLRGHEEFDAALRHLGEAEWETFMQHLMPVLADCYAAVPHSSIARLLALHEAGVLDLMPIGDEADFDPTVGGGVIVSTFEGPKQFDVMVDARGQPDAAVNALPFPSLVKDLAEDHPPIVAPFRLQLGRKASGSVYCLAMPQLLERYPFSQGLPNCASIARVAVEDILESMEVLHDPHSMRCED